MIRSDELVVDCFAGGGGASTGIEWALGRKIDVAINHDPAAVAMHAANHPETVHYCQDIWEANPISVCAGRPVGLAWFSPDCKHFSKAKGGKPVEKKIRDLAWVVVQWARQVRPRIIMLENVEEFRDWGPLLTLADGTQKPDRAAKGQTFKLWVRELEKCGYRVEWRELRACDYGAPTIRKRLFVIARCDGAPIVWPAPTHGAGRIPYRTAAECIDWSIAAPSIFERKKPLAPATLRRIARGVVKYVIEAKRPFLVPITHVGDGRVYGIDEPMRTVTAAHRGEFAVVSPSIVGVGGRMGQSAPRGTDQPFQTITAKADSVLVVPHITKFRTGATGAGADEPMPTVTANSFIKRAGGAAPLGLVAAHLTKFSENSIGESPDEPLHTVMAGAPRHGLVAATLIQTGQGERKGQKPRALDIEKPLGTVVAGGGKHALVAALIAKHYGGHETPGAPADVPLSTVTARDHHALIAPHLINLKGSARRDRPADAPAPAITAGGLHIGEVAAFLVKYYGSGDGAVPVDEPMHTVPTKDRFGVVTVEIDGETYAIADIGMRMLQPRELFNAQGAPSDYDIAPLVTVKDKRGRYKTRALTQTEQIAKCGNMVVPHMSRALVAANAGEPAQAAA